VVIGKVPILLANPYHQADVDHFVEYAKSEYGVKDVVVIDSEIDSAKAVEALDQLLAMNVDAISFHSIDPDAAIPGITQAIDSGIPLITFYTFMTDQIVPHVTINEAPTSKEMGVIAATKWKEFYPDKPIKVGLIEYVGVPQPIKERSEPFIEGILSVDPEAEIVSRLDGGGVMENAMKAAQDMIVANPEINIFYGTSADYSLGTLAALEAAGRGKAENGVPLTEILVGTDASESELLKLFDPNSAFKVTQGLTPKENGRLKVDTLIKMLTGEIGLTDKVEFAGSNFLFDYWNITVEEAEAWMEEQYFSTVSLSIE
jgi:ABC-type sugar transport system substrate-binding protein